MREEILKIFLIILVAIFVMYYFKYNVEGYSDYCEMAFTAKDTIVALKSASSFLYLNGVNLSENKSGWTFENVINEDNNECAVNIKQNNQYLTFDKNNIFLSSIVSHNNTFYLMKISDSNMKSLYNKTVKYLLQNNKKVYDLYVIITSPPFSKQKTKYLTINKESVYLKNLPTISSVWEIEYIKKGEIKTSNFEPTEGIGDFPSKEKQDGAFMPSFLNIWNRTWWSPSNKKNETIQISIELDTPKDTYATGFVRASIVNQIDYKNPFNSKEIKSDYFEGKNSITFAVKSISSNTLFGESNEGTLIIKILPKLINVPLIQGFIINKKVIPLCALPEEGIIQNVMGVCKALKEDMKLDEFMLKNGFNEIDFKNNFNISKNLVNTSDIKPPSKDWVKFIKENNLNDWSYGKQGMSPLPNDPLTQFTAKIPNVASINECIEYANGEKTVPDLYITGMNPVTNKKLTAQEVKDYTDRGIFYHSDDYTLNKDGDYVSGKKGTCNLGMYGNWEPTTDNGIGFIRRSPKVNVDKDFNKIDSIGTYIKGGDELHEGFSLPGKKIIMPNIQLCAELCKQDSACTEFSYDSTSKECRITTGGKPVFDVEAKKDQVYSYKYNGIRNELIDKNYESVPEGNFLGNNYEIIDIQGNKVNVPIKNIKNINDCAKKCTDTVNCDRFSWNADNGDCYLQSMGDKQLNKNLYYSGIKKNFIPQLINKKGFYSPHNKTTFSGRPIPSNSQLSHIATTDECADKCRNNEWCGIASYDAKEKICKMYLPENKINLIPGEDSQITMQKLNKPNVFLSNNYLSKFNQTIPVSHFKGGQQLKSLSTNSSDKCAQACLDNNSCDSFTYNTNNSCTLFQTGDCKDSNSPNCGMLVNNADSPNLYSSKMTSAMEDAEFHNVETTLKCRGELYCPKNFENNLPSSWSNAVCADVVAVYDDGSEVVYDCNTIPPSKNAKGSALRHTRIKCKSAKGSYAYKETGILKGKDCDVALDSRILLGGGLKDGTCDCASYASKINFGKKELEQKEANWKGAQAVYAKKYKGTLDASFNSNDKNNIHIVEKGSPVACYVTKDDTKPFKDGNDCVSNLTEYQCVLI